VGKLKKVLNIMDGSWGMDGERMGEHGKWAHGAKT